MTKFQLFTLVLVQAAKQRYTAHFLTFEDIAKTNTSEIPTLQYLKQIHILNPFIFNMFLLFS